MPPFVSDRSFLNCILEDKCVYVYIHEDGYIAGDDEMHYIGLCMKGIDSTHVRRSYVNLGTRCILPLHVADF